MTILYNAVGWKPAYNLGGPILAVAPLAERLVKRGHRVMVAATDSNLTERLDIDTERWHEVDGVEVRYFRMHDSWTKWIPTSYFRKSNADYRTPALKPWLDSSEVDFDVIHSQLPFIHSNRVCSRFAADKRIPYVYSQHGVFDSKRLARRSLKKRLYLALFELPACRRASALIALTKYEEKTYRQLGLSNKVAVIPNGIDLPAEGAQNRQSAEVVVLFMARMHPIKGADIALEAFLRVRNDVPNARLILAGPDEFGIENALRESIRAANAESQIEITGPVTGDLKQRLLDRADLFVLPTESEGFSIALLEAMANRCAILTTPGAHFDEIEQNRAGRIVPRTVEAFAKSMTEMLTDLELTLKMGDNARQLVERDYTWDKIVDRYELLYDEITSTESRTPR